MAVMISKGDLLQNYISKCDEENFHRNKGIEIYLEEQAIQQQEEIERAENEDYEIEEGKSLDLIYRGNDKNNFSNRISDDQLVPLVKVLEPHAVSIQHIDLRYNHLSDSGAEVLAELLKPAVHLITLSLQSNMIEEDGASAIADALSGHESMLYLNLNGNKIRTKGANKIVELLFSCPAIEELDLGNNDIDHDGVIAITTALNRGRFALRILNLENPSLNSVMQETAIHFAKMLNNNQNLQKLSLRKFRLRCDGIYTIMNHLMENSALKVLDLSCNEISAEGAEYIARYLRSKFCNLESLIMGVNKIGDIGASNLAKAVAFNKSLIHVDLTSNSINDEGLSRLAEALFHNQKLLSFKLFGNNFDQQSLNLFHRLFETPRDNEWYPDFTTYFVDNHVEMAYLENHVVYDIEI